MSQKITIEIDLEELTKQRWSHYEDEPNPMTFADVVFEGASKQLVELVRKDIQAKLLKVVTKAKEEAIRKQSEALIKKTLETGTQKTNTFGEPVGSPFPLRELIQAEVNQLITKPVGYDRDTVLQQIVKQEVKNTFERELRATVQTEKDKVAAAVQQQGAKFLADTITKLGGSQ